MSGVYFTSDTHFNHLAMVDKQWRGQYSTVAEMNEDLIARWNRVVGPKDTVWHLGDYGLGDIQHSLSLVKRLNGTKHLIAGNHDRCWSALRDAHRWQSAYIEAGFASVQAFGRRRILGQSVLLSHFPYVGDRGEDRFEEFRLPDRGAWIIHGHVHEAWQVLDRQINVGVDAWDFQPISLAQVESIMERGWVD